MPINQEGAYESIRFTYQHENDESFQLVIEYHHTEIGPSVTIHNLLDSGPLTLPLSVYVDTVDYLRGRGAIPGGVVAKMATQPARAGNRLTPTRVAGAVQNYAPTKTGAPQSSGDQGIMAQPVYAPQHAILTAEGALDPSGTSQKIQKPTKKPVAVSTDSPVVQNAVPLDMEEEDDPTEELDPAFSLQAGAARRQQGKGANAPKGLKPAGKARNVVPEPDEGGEGLE